MTDVNGIIRAYGAAWLEADEEERRRLLQISWSEDGAYEDPTASVVGREALIRHIADFQKRLPGTKIVFASGVDHHHGKFHFLWKMVGPDGKVASEGRDFGEFDRDGRICRIAGFFGSPPPLPDALIF
ncbi:nuclear transport factor 2 family protein [Bradyrhizobium sp. AUGA SZCCT0431]|uniref:nuclear transport factor 2 family protein n=1 Tax=Bradyrhizobium sp. AUGA SZCCT0431 TaxID=2807674 RepID=UPI001BA55874|nr:nuclear transport factor 2 family protein [Bradyrhizobium sp. AUGA SZCCT0431]MBR1148807.1 nuclear transport factor 2 family protein [Bradyrhizobium sp. AUGA SZCCT0431]